RDEYVIDEELTRVADEIHPRVADGPAASRVGDADHQPERDRQMQNRKLFRLPARDEGHQVDEDSRRHEGECGANTGAGVEMALPREVDREIGKNEQAD